MYYSSFQILVIEGLVGVKIGLDIEKQGLHYRLQVW